ncbi:HAD-IA family hydrolase [Kineosporia sp. J2-2]|uniref:HAD-IA family hydrolase n=2 Tax=Kineosporia corallincola TaxID=2835133 RepID=A0ABS5TT06_9ACTN|nr:HAD-IA family hydrolase [Kineosporia corallincola]
MDGTLIDSTPAVERSWMRWADEYGVHLTGFGTWHGVPAAQIVPSLMPGTPQLWEQATRRIEQIETEDLTGIEVLPGSREALGVLAPAGRAAIATSCVHDLAVARLGATGLEPPEVLVTADMVEVGKPDPAPYLLAAGRLGVDAADCLVVEDAPAGLASGLAAGAARLALTTTHPDGDLDAEAIVPDLSAVRFVITGDGVRVVPA